MLGDIPKGDGYDDWDLENAIEYCRGYLEEGYTREPMDDFDLIDFIDWANKKLING